MACTGGKGTERYALVDLHVVADDGGFADYHTCCMVDEEVLANGCAGVDIDAGTAMGVLGHDAGDERHVLRVQFVCDAVHEDGEEPRIREDDLFLALSCWVAIEGSLDIGKQHALDFGQLLEEVLADFIYTLLNLGFADVFRTFEQQRFFQLAAQ